MNRVLLWLSNGVPFYLISAACMLGGCLAINNSLSWMSTPAIRDILLILQLNVYEVALIGLAWHLIRRRQIHDGVMLACIEAFFLVDVSFLNAQMATGNWALGLAVNVIVFLAAIAKLFCLAKIAGLSWRDGRFAAMTVQLLVLFALPVLFRKLDNGDLSANVFYFGWWMAGLLIPTSLALCSYRDPAAPAPALKGIVKLLSVLPFLSLLLHLGMLHWVYQSPFYAAQTAPVLLGLACALYHVQPFRMVPQRDLNIMQVLLPAIAVLVSLTNPPALSFVIGRHGRFHCTPIDLTLAGAYLTIIYCFARRYAAKLLQAGAVVAGLVVFGPATQELGDYTSRSWAWVSRTTWSIIPKTPLQAGIAAIVSAFAFLGIGATVSLRRKTPAMPSDVSG